MLTINELSYTLDSLQKKFKKSSLTENNNRTRIAIVAPNKRVGDNKKLPKDILSLYTKTSS
jgi:hypothetical protein